MEVALARLVGAGLTLVFEGFEEPAPAGAVEGGLALIQHIARERPELVATLLDGVVRDIWREWRQGKLPPEVAATHLDALPALMETCRCSEGMMLGAVASIQVARRIGAAARPVNHSSRVASAVVGRAIETGFLTSRSLNESIAFFFLDRLLARLMPDQQLFLDLRPLFRDYVHYKLWMPPESRPARPTSIEPSTAEQSVVVEPAALQQSGTDVVAAVHEADEASTVAAEADSSAAPEDAPPIQQDAPAEALAEAPAVVGAAQIAADAGVALHVLEHVARRAAARLGSLPPTMVEDLALGLREMLAALATPNDADATAADLKRRAGEAITACDHTTADQLLGQAEDIHLRAAPADLGGAQGHLVEVAAIRSMRAQLEELVADFRRAARHYASAARCLPENDRRGRRSYLMRQAGAMVAQGELAGETQALAEAAQIYADAGRLLSEQESPLEWALSHLELGRILIELGEREGRSERYLAAVLHFKPAADVLSRLRQFDGWARAQLGIADALRAQGEVQGDVVTLNEAAFSYRAALGVATRDRMPAEWIGANMRLAAALLRLDREVGGVANHNEAVMALRAVLSAGNAATEDVRCAAAARLALALLQLAEARSEAWLADEALAMVRSVYAKTVPALPKGQRAQLDDALGSALMRLAEGRSSAELLSESAELKLAALDHAQRTSNSDDIARLRSDLAEIEAVVGHLTGKVAAEAAA